MRQEDCVVPGSDPDERRNAGHRAYPLLRHHRRGGPILLVVWRLLQSLSAGSEYAGSSSFVIEHVPNGKRALFASINPVATAVGTIGGTLTGLIVTMSVSPEQLSDWGWRIAVIIVGPLGIAGLYLRFKVEETPEFKAMEAEQETNPRQHAPTVEAFRTNKKGKLTLFGWSALNAGLLLPHSCVVVYMIRRVGFTQADALLIYIIGLVAFSIFRSWSAPEPRDW